MSKEILEVRDIGSELVIYKGFTDINDRSILMKDGVIPNDVFEFMKNCKYVLVDHAGFYYFCNVISEETIEAIDIGYVILLRGKV